MRETAHGYVVGRDGVPRRRRLPFPADSHERMREEDAWYQAGFADGRQFAHDARRRLRLEKRLRQVTP